MNGVCCNKLDCELNFHNTMRRIIAYLYFDNFIFYWCPLFVKFKEFFIYLRFFYSCIMSNLKILTQILGNLQKFH
jgi:ABC-type multidrug transport system permease subunit